MVYGLIIKHIAKLKIAKYKATEFNIINLYMNQTVNYLREGYWKDYYSNGKLYYKGNFISGELDGYWEFYYPNGNLWYKGNFISGNKEGYWESYHSNGNLEKQEIYI